MDCRTDAEWRWVGGVPDLSSLGRNVVFVEWNRSNGQRNEDFVAELNAAGVTAGERPVVFICRSGESLHPPRSRDSDRRGNRALLQHA